MKNILDLFRHKIDFIFLTILIVVSAFGHYYLFSEERILSSGDWVYHFIQTYKDLKDYSLYYSHTDLGSVAAFPNNWPFYIVSFLFGKLNLSWDTFTRVGFLFPIIFFTPISSYLAFLKISKNSIIAFFSASLYCFNTFFLKLHLDWLTYGFIWWILPLMVYLISQYKTLHKISYLFFLSFLTFLSITYELRISIIIIFFTVGFTISIYYENKISKGYIKRIAPVFYFLILGIFAHLYFLLPVLKTNLLGDIMNYASANLFTSFFNINDALTLHSYQWNSNLVLEPFYKQNIELHLFIVPLLIIYGLYINLKKYSENYIKYYIAIIYLISLFLVKQSFYPFKNIYSYLFDNFPLFNLYRESSKFFILTAFSGSLFFGYGLFSVFKIASSKFSKVYSIIIAFTILLSVFWNLQHFIDQKIGYMTEGVDINKEYISISEILAKDRNFYRILWYPFIHRFSYYSSIHPSITHEYFESVYSDFNLKENLKTKNLLSLSGVKYIIVPSENIVDIKTSPNYSKKVDYQFRHYKPRGYYLNLLDYSPYYKKVELGIDGLEIYENNYIKPHIYITNHLETLDHLYDTTFVDFRPISPTEYKINLQKGLSDFYLNFSEAYNSNWQIYDGTPQWFNIITQKQKPLIVKHIKNEAGLNTFIFTDYDKSSNLTLYFYPMAYFHLGLYIFASIFLLTFMYFVVVWIIKLYRYKR